MAGEQITRPDVGVTKSCGRCLEVLPVTSFFRDSKKRTGLASYCKACKKATRVYAESYRAKAREWKRSHPDTIKEQWDRWYVNNKARLKISWAEYRSAHREEAKAYAADRRILNPGAVQGALRKYRKNPKNREAIRATWRRRRALKRGAEGFHTAAEIADLIRKQKFRCANPGCHKSVRGSYHADHIQPLSKGGANWISNIQILCEPCNLRKHAKDPFEWAKQNGFLL